MSSENRHPLIVWELSKGCRGFDEGMKYRLETMSGEEFFARNHGHMRHFMEFHGCFGVTEERMTQLRQEALKKSKS